MNPAPQIMGAAGNPEPQVHLLITAGDVALMATNPEVAIEEIRVRATQMSSVLEAILRDTHGHIDWGINE